MWAQALKSSVFGHRQIICTPLGHATAEHIHLLETGLAQLATRATSGHPRLAHHYDGGIFMLFNRTQVIALDLAERQVLGTGQMALGKLFLTANVHHCGIFTVDQQGSRVVVHRLNRRKTSTHSGVNQGACQAEPGCGQQRVTGRKIQILLHLLLSRDQDKGPSIHGDPTKISHLGGKAGAGSHRAGAR